VTKSSGEVKKILIEADAGTGPQGMDDIARMIVSADPGCSGGQPFLLPRVSHKCIKADKMALTLMQGNPRIQETNLKQIPDHNDQMIKTEREIHHFCFCH
jgi:hypothetical protein